MKKVYIITFNEVDYDEYDSFAVLAENKKDVVDIVKFRHSKDRFSEVNWKGGYTIEEVKMDRASRILLSSYNAG